MSSVPSRRFTRTIRQNTLPEFAWHRNYYERVIRNDAELHKFRSYITTNPARWAEDAENPVRIGERHDTT